MENKEQLNQIPEESKNESQDEKTSKQETNPVEETQTTGENPAEKQPVAAEIKDEVAAVETTEVTDVEIPTTEATEESVEKLVSETSTEKVAEETVAEAPVVETVEEPVVDNPGAAVVEDAAEEIVAETPAIKPGEESIEETVVETPVVETVEETVAEAPVAETIEETVQETIAETPVVEAAEETSEELVVEAPAAEVVKETTEEVVIAIPVAKTDEEISEVVDEDEDEDEDEDDDHNMEEHEEEAESGKVDFSEMPRNQLIEALEVLVQDDDVNKIKAKVALIKVAYLKKSKEEKEERYQHFLGEGGDKEEYHQADDPLEEKFNQLFAIYKQKRGIYIENLEKEKVENLAKKKAILEELKQLINSEETLKKTYDDFRALQESWKVIGMVPKSEVNNLWQNYHFLVEMFFDKVKINKELKDLDLKKNLEQKIVLCEKAEELLLETSILKSFKELQRLHEQWKEIGPAPDDKQEEIWDRFKSATEKINLRRRDHYKKLQDEQEGNLIAKTALCEKAESLVTENVNSIREWQNMTKQFNDLFKVWKSIGQAPKKQNDEIWERFKTSLDGFFTEKKEYFGKLKDQQVNNYNIKLDLCVQAEALKDSTEWRNSTRDLINLQKEWREVGPVPRKHSDKIWKRFRSACDEFFNRKADYFSNIKAEEGTNLKKKEDLIKQVEEFSFDGSKGDNLNQLKDFQRQWTEIGFVPFKEKDRLQNAFRDVINKQLDKLNISNTEMTMTNYKSRFEVIKDSPDGDRQIYRERTFIQNKVAKMQEDILLWENNLGFLANSKKADLLKAEFEKKIEAAKKEVAVLQAKVKFLNK